MTVHRLRRGRGVLAITTGALLVVGLAGCRNDSAGSGDSPRVASSRSSVALRTMPAWDPADGDAPVPIKAGTYRVRRSGWSVADFTVAFPAGWTVQYGHVYAKHSDAGDELGFYAVTVDEIYADSCSEDESTRPVGPDVDDLGAALRVQGGGASVGEPVRTTVGGYPATRIDLEIPPSLDLATCRFASVGLQVWYSEPADKYFVLLDDATASVYVVDVEGKRQVFLVQTGKLTSAADRAELQAVLDSIRIEGTTRGSAASTTPEQG